MHGLNAAVPAILSLRAGGFACVSALISTTYATTAAYLSGVDDA